MLSIEQLAVEAFNAFYPMGTVVRCGEASDLFVSATSIPICVRPVCVRPAGHGGYLLNGVQYSKHAGNAADHSDMTWGTWTTREVSK